MRRRPPLRQARRDHLARRRRARPARRGPRRQGRPRRHARPVRDRAAARARRPRHARAALPDGAAARRYEVDRPLRRRLDAPAIPRARSSRPASCPTATSRCRPARCASARRPTRRSRSTGGAPTRSPARARRSSCRSARSTVYRFEERWRDGDRRGFVIECSSGTYVRTLIADLGDAYCEELRRTRIGPFEVADADPERVDRRSTRRSAFLPAVGGARAGRGRPAGPAHGRRADPTRRWSGCRTRTA